MIKELQESMAVLLQGPSSGEKKQELRQRTNRYDLMEGMVACALVCCCICMLLVACVGGDRVLNSGVRELVPARGHAGGWAD